MGIGGGIFLIAVGAILTWAVEAQVSGIDLNVVGIILMIAGAALLLFDLAFLMPRRHRSTVVRESYGAPGVATTGTTVTPATSTERVVRDERY